MKDVREISDEHVKARIIWLRGRHQYAAVRELFRRGLMFSRLDALAANRDGHVISPV